MTAAAGLVDLSGIRYGEIASVPHPTKKEPYALDKDKVFDISFSSLLFDSAAYLEQNTIILKNNY